MRERIKIIYNATEEKINEALAGLDGFYNDIKFSREATKYGDTLTTACIIYTKPESIATGLVRQQPLTNSGVGDHSGELSGVNQDLS